MDHHRPRELSPRPIAKAFDTNMQFKKFDNGSNSFSTYENVSTTGLKLGKLRN